MSENIFSLATNSLLLAFHNFESFFLGYGKKLIEDSTAETEGVILEEVEGLFIDLIDYLTGEQNSFLNEVNTEVIQAAQVFTDFTFPIVQRELDKILGIPD